MTQLGHGGQVWPGGHSPSRGVLLASTPRARLLPGMGYHLRASSALHPQASSAPPTPSLLCLTLANLSSLFLSSLLLGRPAILVDFQPS